MTRHPCLNCLGSDCVDLRLDKKSRPYSVCERCGTRTFLRGRNSMRGMWLLAPRLTELWQSLVAGAGGAQSALDNHADARTDAAIRELRARAGGSSW